MEAIAQNINEQKGELATNQRSKLMIILTLVLVIASMNTTMFNVALPAIGEQFSISPSQSGWIVTSYLIIYAVGSVIYGKLADQFKLKNLLTIGILFMTVGSLIGFIAFNYPLLIIARILQAAGASILPACAMIIPSRFFSPETRGRALGMTSAGLTFGIAIGPIIAGLVTTTLTWNYLFLIPLLMIFSIPLFRKYLDDETGVKNKIDFVGAFSLVATIVSLMLAVSKSNLIFGAAFLVFLIIFIWRIKTAANPFIMPALFKNKAYTLTLLTFAMGAGAGFALPYLSPLLFVDINHLSPFTSGLFMFPGAIIAAALAKTGGKIADMKGNATLAYMAIVLYLICFGVLSFVAGVSPYLVMLVLIFGYLAQTYFQIAMANTLSNTLSKEQTGTGMGLFMLVNFIASSISGTFIGKALSGTTNNALNPLRSVAEGIIYSNIYVVLTLIIVIIGILYTIVLKTTGKRKEA
ncbi:MFS transporter [Paenibacillus sp. EC2-1]|uniref:MFS transporter n=1 Tax=Paenibacillus sp. EC2-1 TaxID=3388665 RepID=UPI003BEF171E